MKYENGEQSVDDNTRLIVNACKQVVQSADDHDSEVMTTPKTVVQAICELDCLLDNIKSYNREEMVDSEPQKTTLKTSLFLGRAQTGNIGSLQG